MADIDHVEEHWPHVAALHRMLLGLPEQVTVATPAPPGTNPGGISDLELARRVARELSKQGGPRIASRAIA